jgi:plasmid maintenance system antidote protein VapI
MTLRKIGHNIEKAMKEKDYDIVSLSSKIGLSECDLTKAIEGRLLLPPNVIKRLANLLGVSVKDLLDTFNTYSIDGKNIEDGNDLAKILDIIDGYSDLLEEVDTNS